MGQPVRVVLNERNRTPHTGWVRMVVWHAKEQRYRYYLSDPGTTVHARKVSKAYVAEDLVPMAGDECPNL